jgi:hypothetical protein
MVVTGAVAAFIMLAVAPAVAGDEIAPALRQRIADAGMMPWTWKAISLDEPLRRGLEREKVPLRQFVTGDKPLLVYMYGYW